MLLPQTQPKSLFSDIYPKSWVAAISDRSDDSVDIQEFRNLQHFKDTLKRITPNANHSSNEQYINYADALSDLVAGTSVMNTEEFTTIRDEVRTVLQKRGLISENIYEGYLYAATGEVLDIAKFIEGSAECMLEPAVKYKAHFYELFISGAYLSGVSLATVNRNTAKILATIQLLEQEHIHIKVTLVTCSSGVSSGKTHTVLLPLFSHTDVKTIETMTSVLNDRFFRIFTFALKEDHYGSELSSGYGRTIDLPDAINLTSVDVETLASSILDKLVV